MGYLCGYYRHNYPLEFLTSYLNNAANDDDVVIGTKCAARRGIQVTMPKWGSSRDEYYFDRDKMVISKGLSSIKYMGTGTGDTLYNLSKEKSYIRFIDVIKDICSRSILDSRQIEILIKIDFFQEFGNQRELLRIYEIFDDTFKRGTAKQIRKVNVDGTTIGEIIKKYSVGVTKAGKPAASYTILDIDSILEEVEDKMKSVGAMDFSISTKVRNFYEALGYYGYVTGNEEDRRILVVTDIFPVRRKKDNKAFGYSVLTKSVGSGKEARFTVFNDVYKDRPIMKDDIIECLSYRSDNGYFTLTRYNKVTG